MFIKCLSRSDHPNPRTVDIVASEGHQAYENRIYATYVWRHGEP